MGLVLTRDASPALFQFVKLIVDNHAHPANAHIQRCYAAWLRCKLSLCMVIKHARIVKLTSWRAARGTLVLRITIWHWGIKDHKSLGEGSL